MAYSWLRKEASARTVYLFSAIVFILFLTHFAVKHHLFASAPQNPGIRRLEKNEERPFIYTYFDVPTNYDPNDHSVALVDAWKKAWYDVGFQPRVVSENDARMVPEYHDIIPMLSEEPMIAEDVIIEFKGWLAMAGVGGGWMADVNTFPLNFFIRHGRFLPNDGMLTIYGGTIPALVSGTGQEFLRVATQAAKTFQKQVDDQKAWNDNAPSKYKKYVDWNMKKALGHLKQKVSKDMYKSRADIWIAKKDLCSVQWTEQECQLTNNKRAVQLGFIGLKTKDAGLTVSNFQSMWHRSCPKTPVTEFD